MRKFLTFAAGLALVASTAFAELPFTGYVARGPIAGTSSTAGDKAALYVQFVNASRLATSKATVAVSAAGDIAFVLNGAADTTVGCPTANGTIDVSDTACNTFVEVVNSINAAGSNWRAVIANALGTDSSNDSLATLSATDTDVTVGLPLYYDTNYAGSSPEVTVLVRPVPLDSHTGSFFFNGPAKGINVNPFAGGVSFLSAVSEKKTSGGTIAATVVYGVRREYRGSPSTGYKLYEVIRTIWSQTGAATATQGTLDFSNFPLISSPGEAFVVRIGSSTTISAQNLNAVGVFAQASQ